MLGATIKQCCSHWMWSRSGEVLTQAIAQSSLACQCCGDVSALSAAHNPSQCLSGDGKVVLCCLWTYNHIGTTAAAQRWCSVMIRHLLEHPSHRNKSCTQEDPNKSLFWFRPKNSLPWTSQVHWSVVYLFSNFSYLQMPQKWLKLGRKACVVEVQFFWRIDGRTRVCNKGLIQIHPQSSHSVKEYLSLNLGRPDPTENAAINA